MLFLQSDFDRVFKNREREPWKTFISDLIISCDEYAVNPFPESDRTRHNWTLERARVLLDITASLGVCYKITGDKKYARKAIEFLFECIDWELWFYKTEVDDCSPYDLGTGETAMTFAIALPLIRDCMTDAEHDTCLNALSRRTLTPFVENTVPGDVKVWWHTGLNNWNCVCNGGQLAISSYMKACGHDAANAEIAIERALAGMQVYFDAMHEDGSCEEGIAYWGYATKYFIMSLLYWENATEGRHPFFDTDKCKNWLRFPFEFSSGNAALGFGDCNFVFSCEMAYAYAARINDAEILAETAARLKNEGGIWALLFTRGAAEPQKKDAKELKWYPDNGWALFKENDFLFSFRSGSTKVSHAMKDMHSVQLARNGEPLLTNMENHPYSVGWFSAARGLYMEENTTAKSAPLFNGIGQIRNADATYKRTGDRIESECADTYPDFIARVFRAAGFDDGGGFYIEDELHAKQEMWHELRFISPGSFERLAPNAARVVNNGQEAVFTFTCDVPIDVWAGTVFHSVPHKPAIGVLRVFTMDSVLKTHWRTVIK